MKGPRRVFYAGLPNRSDTSCITPQAYLKCIPNKDFFTGLSKYPHIT